MSNLVLLFHKECMTMNIRDIALYVDLYFETSYIWFMQNISLYFISSISISKIILIKWYIFVFFVNCFPSCWKSIEVCEYWKPLIDFLDDHQTSVEKVHIIGQLSSVCLTDMSVMTHVYQSSLMMSRIHWKRLHYRIKFLHCR